ncbi:MAG: hypothetical protein WCL10_18930 [Novosphingobium sp.]|uniref:hypothetical protein n=1 Tax=Novosphingobium sp. TaxID=1874826 RepID=UPI0030166BA2
MIDRDSESGAWAKALQAPCTYRTVSEYLSRAADPLPVAADACGTAEINPLAVPPFSDDDPFHIERYTS